MTENVFEKTAIEWERIAKEQREKQRELDRLSRDANDPDHQHYLAAAKRAADAAEHFETGAEWFRRASVRAKEISPTS